jgi:hypothetical protein
MEASILDADPTDLSWERERWLLKGMLVFPEGYRFKPDLEALRFLFEAKYNVVTRKGKIKIFFGGPEEAADQPDFHAFKGGRFEITTTDIRKVRGIIEVIDYQEGKVMVKLTGSEELNLAVPFTQKLRWKSCESVRFMIATIGQGVHVISEPSLGLCIVLNTKTGEIAHFKTKV